LEQEVKAEHMKQLGFEEAGAPSNYHQAKEITRCCEKNPQQFSFASKEDFETKINNLTVLSGQPTPQK